MMRPANRRPTPLELAKSNPCALPMHIYEGVLLRRYRKYGFMEGGAFGGYEKSPFNQFLHLDLVSTQAGPGRAITIE